MFHANLVRTALRARQYWQSLPAEQREALKSAAAQRDTRKLLAAVRPQERLPQQ